jgi:L-lactate dehydrogenase
MLLRVTGQKTQGCAQKAGKMNTLSPKVAIVGAGNVGSSYAFSLMHSGLAREIVLVDRDLRRAEGECMDLNHGLSFAKPTKIYAAGFEGCASADIVVITAGARQKFGQTRMDLVRENVEVFKQVIPLIIRYAPDAILLVVTNPVDILTWVTLRISGYPPQRVFGSGTVLDTSRLRFLMSEYCNVDPRNVHAYIIGEHGDSELPVWSNAHIAGMPLAQYCAVCYRNADCTHALENVFLEVKSAAYKIIEAKGATYYAIALALVRITEAILRDENSILPVSTLITDYYGINNVCLSIPAYVNRSGVKNLLRLELSAQEQKLLTRSARILEEQARAITDILH